MAWSDPHSLLMAVAVVALTAVLVILTRRKKPASTRMKRSMSFTSRLMLDGSMPDNVNMIDVSVCVCGSVGVWQCRRRRPSSSPSPVTLHQTLPTPLPPHTFPSSQPIINAVLLYDDPPADAAIIELMTSMLSYERMSKVGLWL
jgi:hypothetical protein